MLPLHSDGYRLVGVGRSVLRPRYITYLGAAFMTFLVGLYFFKLRESPLRLVVPDLVSPLAQGRLPPLYEDFHRAELRLPHQDWSKTQPSENEKFMSIDGHYRGQGWGNIMQEQLLNAYLAYKSGRHLVFGNYTWRDEMPYAEYNGHKIPAQIPYTALVRGPMVGDPFPAGDPAPRAVTKKYFDKLCPTPLEFNRQEVHNTMSNRNDAAVMVDTWTKIFNDAGVPCIQTTRGSGPIFTYDAVHGIPGALERIWPAFSTSPIITHFGWSPLVELGFDLNRHHFLPPDTTEPYLTGTPFITQAERYTLIPGLMVMHVRRGDYIWHCEGLAKGSEPFTSVHTFPNMTDRFDPPPRGQGDNPENIAHYRKRCFPTIDEIVQKVVNVRAHPLSQGLRRLYIMTNAPMSFIDELKYAISKASDWDAIVSSRDIALSWEQKFVAQAVDLLVAQRAQILLGNGWSTMTSNAVMMRLANGFHPESNRFF